MRAAVDLGIMEGFPPPAAKRVTHRNWQDPPFNRWSFQNVRSVIATRAIHRRAGAATALTSAPEALEEMTFEDIDGEQRTVTAMLDTTYTDGFLMLHRGRIVLERYLNGMTPATLHLSQS